MYMNVCRVNASTLSRIDGGRGWGLECGDNTHCTVMIKKTLEDVVKTQVERQGKVYKTGNGERG